MTPEVRELVYHALTDPLSDSQRLLLIKEIRREHPEDSAEVKQVYDCYKKGRSADECLEEVVSGRRSQEVPDTGEAPNQPAGVETGAVLPTEKKEEKNDCVDSQLAEQLIDEALRLSPLDPVVIGNTAQAGFIDKAVRAADAIPPTEFESKFFAYLEIARVKKEAGSYSVCLDFLVGNKSYFDFFGSRASYMMGNDFHQLVQAALDDGIVEIAEKAAGHIKHPYWQTATRAELIASGFSKGTTTLEEISVFVLEARGRLEAGDFDQIVEQIIFSIVIPVLVEQGKTSEARALIENAGCLNHVYPLALLAEATHDFELLDEALKLATNDLDYLALMTIAEKYKDLGLFNRIIQMDIAPRLRVMEVSKQRIDDGNVVAVVQHMAQAGFLQQAFEVGNVPKKRYPLDPFYDGICIALSKSLFEKGDMKFAWDVAVAIQNVEMKFNALLPLISKKEFPDDRIMVLKILIDGSRSIEEPSVRARVFSRLSVTTSELACARDP